MGQPKSTKWRGFIDIMILVTIVGLIILAAKLFLGPFVA